MAATLQHDFQADRLRLRRLLFTFQTIMDQFLEQHLIRHSTFGSHTVGPCQITLWQLYCKSRVAGISLNASDLCKRPAMTQPPGRVGPLKLLYDPVLIAIPPRSFRRLVWKGRNLGASHQHILVF